MLSHGKNPMTPHRRDEDGEEARISYACLGPRRPRVQRAHAFHLRRYILTVYAACPTRRWEAANAMKFTGPYEKELNEFFEWMAWDSEIRNAILRLCFPPVQCNCPRPIRGVRMKHTCGNAP